MGLRVTQSDGCTVLAIDGRLDLGALVELRGRLREALIEDPDCVVCDISEATGTDANVFSVIAATQREVGWPGPTVWLAGATGALGDKVRGVGAGRFVAMADTLRDALAQARTMPPRLRETLHLPPHALAPRHVRRWAAETCARWDLAAAAEDAALICSELVTNAVRHVQGALTVHLEHSRDRLFVAVHDHGPLLPTDDWGRLPPEPSEGGRGLLIVRGIGTAQGSHAHPTGGKVVWSALALRSDQGRRAPPAVPAAADEAAPLQRPGGTRISDTVVVQAEHGGVRGHGPWSLRLMLTWRSDDADVVLLSLVARPAHPSQPQGTWRIGLAELRQSLVVRVVSDDVHLRPERGVVRVALPSGSRRTVATVSCDRLQRLFDRIDAARGR